MTGYYSVIIGLSWLSLGVLSLLVYENARIRKEDKRLLYLTYALIALSALAEYLGVMFNGRENLSGRAILFFKTADYILTPLSGGAIILQMRMKNRWNAFIIGLLAFNTILQLFSTLGGWMVRVDENNQYHHGPLFPLYFFLCLVIVGVVLLQFVLYGRSYRRQNRPSLFSIILLIFAGILIQQLSDGEIRIAYLSLTLGAALIFIHYVEFGAQVMDDNLRRQQHQLDTDELTGVYSRHAYSLALNNLDGRNTLPAGLAVFTVDINGLKQVNDKLGHEAGDELIRGAAECITDTLCENGNCYRTGGDEYVVLAYMDRGEAETALANLYERASHWDGKAVHSLSLAAGFALAAEHEGLTVEKLVGQSDLLMYEAKAAYYRSSGRDRRKRAPATER